MKSLYKYSIHHVKLTLTLFAFLIIVFAPGCKKFLDEKPLKSDVVPTSLADLQALLNNPNNNTGVGGAFELLADNCYVTSADYNAYITYGIPESYYYSWNSDAPIDNLSWLSIYQGPIYYANIVLDQLELLKPTVGTSSTFNQIKGEALFLRAFSFYELAQEYCKPYSASSSTDPGILLKQTSDINEVLNRGTVTDTYSRIITDLKAATDILPIKTSFPTYPSRVAAFAELARVYLSMRDYVNAGFYADQALQIYSSLIDYNSLIPVGAPPIASFNKEVIYHSEPLQASLLTASVGKIDSNLYKSYNSNDLRKTVFFRANTGANIGTYRFRGSYGGTKSAANVFNGLTTAEMYLIRAECSAKLGRTIDAIGDLNTLLSKRWLNNLFVPYTASTANEALQKIRIERRKELLYHGLRWTDIRRYNLEDSTITMKRIINGTVYSLPPNDKRSVMLIPADEVIKRGIGQNPR